MVVHLGRRDGVRILEEIAVLRRGEDGMLLAETALRSGADELREGPAAGALAARLRTGAGEQARFRAGPAEQTARAPGRRAA